MSFASKIKLLFTINDGFICKGDEMLTKNIDLETFFHDFSFFGIENKQISEMYYLNQRSKAPIIIAYIALAIAKCKNQINDDVTFAELFCADGYYSMVAAHLGATKSYGIDHDKENYFEKSKRIAKKIKISNIEFIEHDVNNLESIKIGKVDIVANIGGLYHVGKPEEVLIKSYNMAKKYLIIQSVVSMANEDPNYFESPAPGWSWGSRYNRVSFEKMIKKLGYTVIDYHFNELEGNHRPEDRGSVYYLIKVD